MFIRGLAIVLPSVLTLVILLWLLSLVNSYIISPTSYVVRIAIASVIDSSVESSTLVAIDDPPALPYCEKNYLVTKTLRENFDNRLRQYSETNGKAPSNKIAALWVEREYAYANMGERAVPFDDYAKVAENIPASQMPRSAINLYMELVLFRHFQSVFLLNLFVILVLFAIIYFLGRVVSVRLGSWFVVLFERKVIGGVPVVRNVYASVKQITDFLFSDNQIEYRRVVAIEYPRKGIWSLGFVTGESMKEIVGKAGEDCLTVLVPTSPMPMTGYTMSVPRTEILDLDITVEQAFQFCVSCGVLVPPQQKISIGNSEVNIAMTQAISESNSKDDQQSDETIT